MCLYLVINFIGIRLLGGVTTDAQDASAVSYQRNAIDIYSNSWGPADYGCIVGGPETLTLTALEEGTQSVRLYSLITLEIAEIRSYKVILPI